jgi:hypothetical protein
MLVGEHFGRRRYLCDDHPFVARLGGVTSGLALDRRFAAAAEALLSLPHVAFWSVPTALRQFFTPTEMDLPAQKGQSTGKRKLY